MKFDLVIGNVPYNRGIVKKHQPVYYHKAMNAGREGTIGFFIENLKCLQQNGILIYVSPIKFLRGPGCTETRDFLFSNFKLIKVLMKDPKIFKNVGCDKIGITIWTTGITDIVDVDGVIVNPYEMPDLIVPAFSTQDIANQYVSDIQFGLLGRPIGGPKAASNNYQIVFQKTFLRSFRLEQPGYQLGSYENAYAFDNETDAKALLSNLKQITLRDKWSSCEGNGDNKSYQSELYKGMALTRNTHCITRYLPYYNGIQISRHTYTATQYLPNLP